MARRSTYPSCRGLSGIGGMAVVLLLLTHLTDSAHPDDGSPETFWQAGIPRHIAVNDGRARFRYPSSGSSQMLVVVSALSQDPGPFPIRLTTRSVPTAELPALASDRSRRPASVLEGRPSSSNAAPSDATPSVSLPLRERSFHLLTRDGDPSDAGNYVAVRGILKGVGRKVQVYVGAEDVRRVASGTVRDIITTFDDRIYPATADRLAPAHDVDGDRRFTILVSSWLDHIGGGRHAVDGFVRVTDLDPSMPAPFGNRCDMMYLNASVESGPYLRTLLAHEYMHAVIYTCKTLDSPVGHAAGPEEEGWLDEAIAHLAEDRQGFSAANLDYRVSAFLSSPERYRLVVDDYFAADLFRSHGNRGSTYLFLRWCVDQYGPELIPRLILSPRRGIANLEAATGTSFADLFRRWSLALFVTGLDPSRSTSVGLSEGLRSLNLYAPWADRDLSGPRFRRVTPANPADSWESSGTSAHYVVIDGGDDRAVEVQVEGPPRAEVQVTALPLGSDRARLNLSIESRRGEDDELEVVLRVAEHNGIPIRLSSMAWEPLCPGPRPSADSRLAGRMDMLGIASTFGTSWLAGRGVLTSGRIPMPGVLGRTDRVVVKIRGTDPMGRHATAWAELDTKVRPASIGIAGKMDGDAIERRSR